MFLFRYSLGGLNTGVLIKPRPLSMSKCECVCLRLVCVAQAGAGVNDLLDGQAKVGEEGVGWV